jgi:excisionase family DNA binding protein
MLRPKSKEVLRQRSVTVPQLARELGLSRVAVWKKIRKGEIPATKVGRQYVISEHDARVVAGKELSPDQRRWIKATVRRVVCEYGEVLKRLSHE